MGMGKGKKMKASMMGAMPVKGPMMGAMPMPVKGQQDMMRAMFVKGQKMGAMLGQAGIMKAPAGFVKGSVGGMGGGYLAAGGGKDPMLGVRGKGLPPVLGEKGKGPVLGGGGKKPMSSEAARQKAKEEAADRAIEADNNAVRGAIGFREKQTRRGARLLEQLETPETQSLFLHQCRRAYERCADVLSRVDILADIFEDVGAELWRGERRRVGSGALDY